MSKYRPLGDYFNALRTDSVTLTFTEIENMLGFELPDYTQTPAAWINDPQRPQAKQWLDAGFRRERVDFTRREVSFFRAQPGIPSPEEAERAAAEEDIRDQALADEQQRQIEQNPKLSATEKQRLIRSRIGQDLFRQRALQIEPCCRLTGVTAKNFLIASHIKPWKDCNNVERLDGDNGLMLAPHVDRLFDRGWISFEDSGELRVSAQVAEVLEAWHLPGDITPTPFNPRQAVYLAYHRREVFKP